ncbi:MAG: flagellin, partial [Pseudomonadota bacterium]
VMGAAISRFEAAQDFLSTKIDALQAARSGLADLDVAAELTRRTSLELQNISGLEVLRDGQSLLALNSLLFAASERVNAGGFSV